MSIKKMAFLVTSFLVFLIVTSAVCDTISYSIKQAKEKVAIVLNYEVTPKNTIKSYNYVEIAEVEKEVVKEDQNNINIQTDQAVFTGKMTGYGADCVGCNNLGILACRTSAGSSYSLVNNGKYYADDTYGEVRIIAADLSKFPCGTIMKINNANLGEFYAVVLDTGGSVSNAWANGQVWIDLAFITESDPEVYLATTNSATFTVQRWGW